MGLFSRLAFSKASGPHGYQSTGLWACCRRYGLFSPARRLVYVIVPPRSARQGLFGGEGGSARFHPISRRPGGKGRPEWIMSPTFRIERDSMGEMQVPAQALYGAQT